jgi:hypothetical protein
MQALSKAGDEAEGKLAAKAHESRKQPKAKA